MVSIIILSFNTKDLLESCISSIFKLLKKNFEVIVVDNASSDESVSMVKKQFKDITLIENKKNVGFAAGANIGAKNAKGKYLLFLNSDTQLLAGDLEKVERIFEDESIAIAGGVQVDESGRSKTSYGNMYSIFHLPLFGSKSVTSEDNIPPDTTKEVGWVNGACFFIKKDVFDKLGGFDENFFMYMEDVDLCYRAKKQGYQTVLTSHFVVRHKEHGSSDRTFAIVQIYKGLLYFFKKHKNNVEYLIVKLLLIAKAIILMGIGVISNNKYLLTTYKKAMYSII